MTRGSASHRALQVCFSSVLIKKGNNSAPSLANNAAYDSGKKQAQTLSPLSPPPGSSYYFEVVTRFRTTETLCFCCSDDVHDSERTHGSRGSIINSVQTTESCVLFASNQVYMIFQIIFYCSSLNWMALGNVSIKRVALNRRFSERDAMCEHFHSWILTRQHQAWQE